VTGLTCPNDLEMEASAPPRPVEPRLPAARCGLPLCPGHPGPIAKPPSNIKTSRQVDHIPVDPKHLKSVVLRHDRDLGVSWLYSGDPPAAALRSACGHDGDLMTFALVSSNSAQPQLDHRTGNRG
jgi:hypothetical protein